MKTITLTLMESQAPACPVSLPENKPVPLDVAAERLELLRLDIETQARRHWQQGEDADGMADWLKSAALRLAIRTLQTRLAGVSLALLPTASFDHARRVLWDAANDWTKIAALALTVPDPETQGSALTNAAALRYAAQLLTHELPASQMALAA